MYTRSIILIRLPKLPRAEEGKVRRQSKTSKKIFFFLTFFFHRLHRDGVIKSVKYTWCALFINTVFILKCSHICANKKIWTNIKINEQNFGHAIRHSLSSRLFQVWRVPEHKWRAEMSTMRKMIIRQAKFSFSFSSKLCTLSSAAVTVRFSFAFFSSVLQKKPDFHWHKYLQSLDTLAG